MKSAWFWGTAQWEKYQRAYFSDRPRVEEYKSSPLSGDGIGERDPLNYDIAMHESQVLNLTLSQAELWRGIRKSYRPLINKALVDYRFTAGTLADYHRLHALASGRETRSHGTWDCMDEWMANGYGGLVMASKDGVMAAGAYFIIYQGGAYYASGASLIDNVQHAVIWTAMKRLKDIGVGLLELGQIDGETEKEKSIGFFKSGMGGKSMPFTIATRRAV